MKARKILSLLLALVMLVAVMGVFTACGGARDVIDDGGDRGADGSWAGVNFQGQEVKMAVSVNQYVECSFPAADIYTKGPDKANANEVCKEVLARNARVKNELGINVTYIEKDLTYIQVPEDVRVIVQTAAKDSPDIYNNDIWGLSRVMNQGLLWNCKDPGDDVKNYFDFTAEGWYTEFIKGSTFDQEKLYLFAGDYFIDMIRLAWVVFVNNDLLASNLKKMPSWCKSVDEFYSYVGDGFWDYDVLRDIINRVSTDGAGGESGVTDKTDTLIGFGYNNVTHWAFLPSSGVTIFYQDKADGYKPKVIESIDTFQKVANKWQDMIHQFGTFFEVQPLDCTRTFMGGNVLFCSSRLGEMESPELRDVEFAKGVIPVPKWDMDAQDDYHTIVHDQTEIGCILNTAQAYSAASAFMQFVNEESDDVMYAYFDKGLKYKYNDDKNSREMMDIIRESTDAPFGSLVGKLCKDLYSGTGALHDITLNSTSISSTFGSEKDAYKNCLDEMIKKFAAFK